MEGGSMTLRDTARSLLKLLKCRLCRTLCGDHFFNRDASLEIDRLVVENERLRERLRAVERERGA
jgi:hypothetical protein